MRGSSNKRSSGNLKLVDDEVQAWLKYLFEHPEGKQVAYEVRDALDPGLGSTREAELIAWVFENSEAALEPYSNRQLGSSFWYSLTPTGAGHFELLNDTEVSSQAKERVLRSFVLLFRSTMTTRCQGQLECAGESEAGSLDRSCYMWWDLIEFMPDSEADADRRRLESVALKVMESILDIPHDTCRESALHGLGHWQGSYPKRVADCIDDFVRREPDLRPELMDYAAHARRGEIL